MTVVSRELARISNTLGRGIAGIGLSRLAGERSKRESAELDYRLGRNRAYDERAADLYESGKSVRELAGLTAQTEIDRRNEPADFNDLTPDALSAYHAAKHIMPGLMGIHQGEKYIQDENNVTRLQRKDGSFVTKYDRETRRQEEIGFIKSKYKLKSTVSDMMARWEEKKQRVLEMGIPMAGTEADKEIARLNKNISGGADILNSPEKMIQRLKAQIVDLQQYGNYPEEINRIKGEIKEQEAKIAAQAKAALEERKVKVLEAREKRETKKGGLGGLTADQYLKWTALTPKQKAGIRQKAIEQYNKTYTNPMAGGLVEDAPNREKYIGDYIVEAMGEKKESTPDTDEETQKKTYFKFRAQGKSKEEAYNLSLGRGGAGGSF